MALRVDEQPSQSFSAGFELKGSIEQGELQLLSPLGTAMVDLQWSRQGAWLRAPGRSETYDSLQALVNQANGSPLPVAALFEWLQGKPSSQDGWTVNLEQHAQGRIFAKRNQPATDLRIILDQP